MRSCFVQVKLVEVKPEVKTVVNLIDPALAAAKVFSTATASSEVKPAAQPAPAVAVKTEKSAGAGAPAGGVKRTIMDMFGPAKKATVEAPVKVEGDMEVVKLEDA